MTDATRKQRWEQLYRTKPVDELSWHQAEPCISLQLIEHSGVQFDDAIIDVGGGASVLVDRLLAKGYQTTAVLDISGAALSRARQRLGKGADRVEWYETDVTEFVPPHTFSLWHDRAVFHFLTAVQDRCRYVEVLRGAVPRGGHVIIASFALDGPTECSGFDVERYDEARLMDALGEGFTLIETIIETHVTPAAKEQRFQYFRLARD